MVEWVSKLTSPWVPSGRLCWCVTAGGGWGEEKPHAVFPLGQYPKGEAIESVFFLKTFNSPRQRLFLQHSCSDFSMEDFIKISTGKKEILNRFHLVLKSIRLFPNTFSCFRNLALLSFH